MNDSRLLGWSNESWVLHSPDPDDVGKCWLSCVGRDIIGKSPRPVVSVGKRSSSSSR